MSLLLVGQARTNIFDGETRLGSGADVAVFKGIDAKAEVGMLALFEHYKSLEVGNHLKHPISPVWVVWSESHYSALFSTEPDLPDPQASRFDLYYYDQLMKQEDVYRFFGSA